MVYLVKYSFLSLLFILLASSLPLAAEGPPLTPAEDFQALRTLEPRPEGSKAEKTTIDYIAERLDSLSLSYRIRDFSSMENSHSYSRIIETTVEGRRSENFLLAVPLNGDSTNILLALSFLERLKNSFGSDNGPPASYH